MEDIKNLLYRAWMDGFTHGLEPGLTNDPFEKWFMTIDLAAWIIAGKLKSKDVDTTIYKE